MPLPRSLPELLGLHGDRVLEDVFTSMPAKVLAFHPATNTVDVEFVAKVPFVVRDDEVEWDVLPNLTNVPVAVPNGGGFFASFPLAAGDFVTVHATAASINQWLYEGRVPSEGPETKRHSIGSTWAALGVRPTTAPIADVSGSELRIGKNGTDLQIRIDGSAISLGAGASDFVALASKVDAGFDAIKNMFSSWVVVAMDGGAALKTLSSSLSSIQPVGATKVKAK